MTMWKRLKVMVTETVAALRGWRQLRGAWKADQEMRRKDRAADQEEKEDPKT
jgi:hypothetical protein